MHKSALSLGFILPTIAHASSSCPCGLEGDTCDVLAEGFTSSLSNACAVHSDCEPNSNGTAFCLCRCGSTGEFCNTHRVGTVVNYVLGYLLVFGMIALIFLAFRRYKDTKLPDVFRLNSADFAEPRGNASPAQLFAFRLVIFLFAVGTQIFRFITAHDTDGKFYSPLEAYTVWNFIILIVYFGIGVYLSYLSMGGRLSAKDQPTFLQRVHVILMEVELPSAFLVDVVTWTVLLPTAYYYKDYDAVTTLYGFASIVQHIFNFLFTFSDFLMTKYQFVAHHIFWMLLLPTVYTFYHLCRMVYLDSTSEPHCPVYPFMQMENRAFPLWVVGLALIHVLFYYGAFRLSRKLKTPREISSEIAGKVVNP